MGFVGNYAPCGLSPQMYDMPVILKKSGHHARSSHLLSEYASEQRSLQVVLTDNLLTVLDKDTLSVLAYALTCKVVNRSVLVNNCIVCGNTVDTGCAANKRK